MKIWDKIKAPFQYDGLKTKKKSDRYSEYLTKKKFRLMGIKKIIDHDDFASFLDQNKNDLVIIKTSLKKQNGTNEKTDAENYKLVTEALDEIQGICKVILRSNQMERLSSNLDYAYRLYTIEKDEEIKKDILERIRYMEILNHRGEMLSYLFVKKNDFKKVLEKLEVPFYCEVLNKEQLKEFMFSLLNWERGEN